MTIEEINTIINDLETKEFNLADIIAKLTEEGYIPNKNKEQKLQWSIMLINVFRNISIFDQNKVNKFINFYIKFNRL